MFTHVPLCHTCNREVAGPFTNDLGEGFCSAECEAEAQAEFAGWTDEQDSDCYNCGVKGKFYDDLCYQCQCDLHAIGTYDMDGDGWQ